jgi:hypothetical protein
LSKDSANATTVKPATGVSGADTRSVSPLSEREGACQLFHLQTAHKRASGAGQEGSVTFSHAVTALAARSNHPSLQPFVFDRTRVLAVTFVERDDMTTLM